MNLAILNVNNIDATMTSLDLVERINRARRVEANEAKTESQSIQPNLLRHDNFMAKLEKHPGIDSPKFLGQYKDGAGRTLKCYFLPRRECELMIMSESLLVQTRVYDQLAELTAKQAAPTALSVMDILTLAIESERGRLLAVEQRDHAIATKAQIGSKREATAMATASAAKKESAALKAQLGFNEQHATVKAVQAATGKPYAWLPLRRWCEALNQPPKNVTDPLYGAVKAWPSGAWAAVYSVDLVDLFGEVTA